MGAGIEFIEKGSRMLADMVMALILTTRSSIGKLTHIIEL